MIQHKLEVTIEVRRQLRYVVLEDGLFGFLLGHVVMEYLAKTTKFVKDTAERPHICLLTKASILHNFWRAVMECAHLLMHKAIIARKLPRNSEIAHLAISRITARICQQEVAGLEVAMDNLSAVHFLECEANLNKDLLDLLDGEGTLHDLIAHQVICKVPPVAILNDEVNELLRFEMFEKLAQVLTASKLTHELRLLEGLNLHLNGYSFQSISRIIN